MNRTLISAVLALLFVSCATTAPPPPVATESPLWLGLKAGPYQVGFRASLLNTAPHPLQISAWYPADRGGSPMAYRDYMLLNLTEARADEPAAADRTKALDDAKAFLTGAGISPAAVEMLVSAPMYARRDAPGLVKKFPLIFVVQGNGQGASGQAILAEYLASHGYVVATIPSITRLTGQMTSVEEIVPKAEAEMADIERAVNAIKGAPNVIGEPIALVAHSFGARSAMLYAMHHPTIAFVSLEGGIGTGTGQTAMLASTVLKLTAPMPPILHFYELNDDRIVPDFRMLKSLRTPDLQLERRNSMQHVHFSSDGFAAALLPEMAKVTQAGPDLKSDLTSVMQQTLAFLDKQWATKRVAP